jgi:glutamate dehydrogenase/leucine dehydrogenase
VIPMTENCGVLHPQEGVLNGHFKPTDEQRKNRIEQLKSGVLKVIENPLLSPDVDRKYVVADMITGYGVAQSIQHYYTIWGGSLKGKKVIVQGWGNVASAGAYYLAQEGALIVGIIDRVGGLIKSEGFTFEEIKSLYLNKNGNELNHENLLSYEEMNSKIWDLEADVFIPCAGSRMITQDQLDRMIKAGVEVISSGANVPFADPQIFFGPIAEHADRNISIIPDFISNCGMARVFAYLMSSDLEAIDDNGIFADTSATIKTALEKTFAINNKKTEIAKTAFEIALKQLI